MARVSSGFSLVELMVSVFIITLIATTSVMSLRASQQKDELNTAARVVAADLRDAQSRALTGQNVRSCPDGSGKRVVCEATTSGCADPMACAPQPPYGVGLHLVAGQSTYTFFADVDASKNDWKQTDPSEVFLTHDLAQNGAPNVIIDQLIGASASSTDIAFQRQNGSMVTQSTTMTIRLRHRVSNDTKDVMLNSITGRISIN